MGRSDVTVAADARARQAFARSILDDLSALETMIERGMLACDERWIGAEQEIVLVNGAGRPAAVAEDVLQAAQEPRLTTELARFNLEANLSPRRFEGRCLSELGDELRECLHIVDEHAGGLGARALLTGILPTLRQSDLKIDNMARVDRYAELNREARRLRGEGFRVFITGLDELQLVEETVMAESCNTSFQLHFQVSPEEFAPLYNLAQAITGPILAAAVNSPMLFGRRLWHETRIALFEHSTDTRSAVEQGRGQQSRVQFGSSWVRESVTEILREDIARFQIMLTTEVEPDPLGMLERGEVPELHALRLHNGTVYRWNRPCYGVSDGKPHLRIENRVLPAGPTVIDELANAALYFGLMAGMSDLYPRIDERMPFAAAKSNFFAAARHGMSAQFDWIGGERRTARDLLIEELIPVARAGLERSGVDGDDIATYLGVIQARAESGRTGAQWILDSVEALPPDVGREEGPSALVAAMYEHQVLDEPGHTWGPAELAEAPSQWRADYETVGQIMSTDLFTVRPDDIVDLAASVMDWRHVRQVPVEDERGRLVGIVSHRSLLRLLVRGQAKDREPVAVSQIMTRDPVAVTRETPTLEAMRLMRERGVAALPVVDDGFLVGILTERDLMELSGRLLERFLESRPLDSDEHTNSR